MKKERERGGKYYSVTVRLLLSVFAIVLLLIVVQTGLNLYLTRRHYESMERQILYGIYDDYQNEVFLLETMAESLAVSLADRPDIVPILINGDRQGMLALLSPIFQTLETRYGIVLLNVRQPDGTVFARAHAPDSYGDAPVLYQHIITTALVTQQPTAGIELGRHRLGIRGIAPIFDETRFVGLAEVGLDYGEVFLKEAKTRYNVDYTIWISSDAAALVGLTLPDEMLTAPSSELLFYTNTHPLALPIPESVYLDAFQRGQTSVQFVSSGGQNLAVLVAPVKSFGDRIVGVLEIQSPRTVMLETLRNNQSTTLLVSAILATLALILMWLSTHMVVLRVLHHLTAVAQRQLEGDLTARVEILPHDEFGRMGHTLNRLTEQLGSSISKLELQVDMLRRAERALGYEQYLTQALLNTVPDHIYFKDLQSRFIRISKSQAERFGLDDPSGALGKTDFDFFSEEHASQAYRDEQEIIRTGRPIVGVEEKETWPNGIATWVSSTKMPLMDENGEIMGIFGISRDITDYKNSVGEVLRLQHLLQNISDSMPSALIALNATGQVLLWNPAAQALTGCTLNNIVGQPIWEVCPVLARYRSMFEEVLRTQQGQHRHKEAILTSAEITIYHNVEIFPLTSDTFSGAVMRIDDVTERVQLEEMMLQSAKMASVGGLAAGVAHELNNPLGAMIQSAQVLQMILDVHRPQTQERLAARGLDVACLDQYLQERGVHEYLTGIRQTGERAAKIVSDLLNFSRKSVTEFTPQNLNALVEQTLDLAATDYDLKKKYDFKDVAIVRETADEVPSITCDKQQIQQVILNLVRNAAYAMSEKKAAAIDESYHPQLTIRTRVVAASGKANDGYVRLEVDDNGPGLSEATQAHLFEPFFTTKDVGEGTGLGLWLCWSIVIERHRGRIWGEPNPEGGARFVVELPIVHR
ncbi:MAG: PAS domain-containing protein [Anaerolineae bacterium]|nr:PAS domain-containing protein [Anaerolineae bacterium]